MQSTKILVSIEGTTITYEDNAYKQFLKPYCSYIANIMTEHTTTMLDFLKRSDAPLPDNSITCQKCTSPLAHQLTQ